MLKFALSALAAAALCAGSAQAQTTTQTPPIPGVSSPTATTAPVPMKPTTAMPEAGAPLPGANSFTQAQAISKIESLGYTNVVGLEKDANGVWRGKATRDGQVRDVALDFRGNIVIGQK